MTAKNTKSQADADAKAAAKAKNAEKKAAHSKALDTPLPAGTAQEPVATSASKTTGQGAAAAKPAKAEAGKDGLDRLRLDIEDLQARIVKIEKALAGGVVGATDGTHVGSIDNLGSIG